ncbi:Hypothetical protein NTJ_01482 [Nesidiocoris tenuis]|uniref:Uncharacterized protein n=1 Tax=Nesidiocoris tenuis TaxID=355587 RepID=A0ABN7A8P3_9HEMI|nr:Hypothetical protein NTJ_01482 [Nesidiocoris tenuis]
MKNGMERHPFLARYHQYSKVEAKRGTPSSNPSRLTPEAPFPDLWRSTRLHTHSLLLSLGGFHYRLQDPITLLVTLVTSISAFVSNFHLPSDPPTILGTPSSAFLTRTDGGCH